MENAKMINDKFNGIRVWQRDDGKFGIEDMGSNEFSFRMIENTGR